LSTRHCRASGPTRSPDFDGFGKKFLRKTARHFFVVLKDDCRDIGALPTE
jgi:hypothetical protein